MRFFVIQQEKTEKKQSNFSNPRTFKKNFLSKFHKNFRCIAELDVVFRRCIYLLYILFLLLFSRIFHVYCLFSFISFTHVFFPKEKNILINDDHISFNYTYWLKLDYFQKFCIFLYSLRYKRNNKVRYKYKQIMLLIVVGFRVHINLYSLSCLSWTPILFKIGKED